MSLSSQQDRVLSHSAELDVAPAREGTARAVGGSGGVGASFFQYAAEREQFARGRGGRHAVVHYMGRKSCDHGQMVVS